MEKGEAGREGKGEDTIRVVDAISNISMSFLLKENRLCRGFCSCVLLQYAVDSRTLKRILYVLFSAY